MGKSEMRSTCTYVRKKCNINRKEEKNLEVVKQDNFTPKKHIDKIFSDSLTKKYTNSFSLPR